MRNQLSLYGMAIDVREVFGIEIGADWLIVKINTDAGIPVPTSFLSAMATTTAAATTTLSSSSLSFHKNRNRYQHCPKQDRAYAALPSRCSAYLAVRT